jgi:hypothetical protein
MVEALFAGRDGEGRPALLDVLATAVRADAFALLVVDSSIREDRWKPRC